MDTSQVIQLAQTQLEQLPTQIFDVLTIAKPVSASSALNLAKIISKLSPIMGNLIEFNIVELLNQNPVWSRFGKWVRQDPDFPDAVFEGAFVPTPGFEIKAWFPLSTEITARFKPSQQYFADQNIHVVLVGWIPENIIYGRPQILKVSIIEAGSIAISRDHHYHRPPDYVVTEPENTLERTVNLRQTNTNGYKWQGTPAQLKEAVEWLNTFGYDVGSYRLDADYQQLMKQLLSRYNYRLDTNFAKLDRIAHPDIERFKTDLLETSIHGMALKDWIRVYNATDEQQILKVFRQHLGIG
ncbi:MAG: hypothetical protein ACOYLB_17600 [Phototrophicaceae bacterium]